MKRALLPILGLVALALFCGAPTLADSTNLQINGASGDPNLVYGGSFSVYQTSASAGTIDDLILLFSVPGVTSTGTGGISVTSTSSGTPGTAFLVGSPLGSGLSPCNNTGNDVYSCAGISGTNQSNNLNNFNNNESLYNGFTASSYGIYEVIVTGADLTSKSAVTINGSFPLGTFIDAYGIDTTGKPYDMAFTTAGLYVPEPSSSMLLGVGLLGLALLGGRRVLLG